MTCEACGAGERYIVNGACRQCGHAQGAPTTRGLELGAL